MPGGEDGVDFEGCGWIFVIGFLLGYFIFTGAI